jgi:thioredoxin reductase (NADPH)
MSAARSRCGPWSPLAESMGAAEPTEVAETPDRDGAFPRLSESQIETLTARGRRSRTTVGECLYRQGDSRYDFFVILEGLVSAHTDADGVEPPVAVHGPRRFLGELSLLTGQPAFYTTVVREAGEVVQAAPETLRRLVGEDPALGDLVLRAFLLRRELLSGLGAGLKIVGSRYLPDTRRLCEFAARNRLPFRWIDPDGDPEAEALLERLGILPEETPVVVWGSRIWRNPGNAELAAAVGMREVPPRNRVSDLVVVGAGPAGLAAAVYAASEGLTTVLLDRDAPGGQAGTSSRIENYLGFPYGVSGDELADNALMQVRKFEVEVLNPINVKSVRIDGPFKHLQTSEGGEGDGAVVTRDITCKALVLTMGLAWQRLPAACADQFEGRGIYYGAASTEELNCRGQVIYIIGAGNSAGQAAMHLVEYASKVVMVVRGRDLGDRMSQYLWKRIRECTDPQGPCIEVLTRTEVVGCRGADRLEGLTLKNLETGELTQVESNFLFVFIGAVPRTDWLGDQVVRDAHGFIVTGPDLDPARDLKAWPLERPPFLLEASVPGVFAAGDVRHESVKRVASAVGEGSVAVTFIHRYLASL